METIFNIQLEKIEMLNDICDLIPQKSHIAVELSQLSEAINKEKKVVQEVVVKMNEFKNIQQPLLKKLIPSSTQQLTRMLNVMNKLDQGLLVNKDADKQTSIQNPNQLFKTPERVHQEVPRLYLNDYMKSPLIRQKKPLKLEFLDFEAQISTELFNKIPSYMRGRESLEDLRDFLDNVIIKCFTEKYKLMYKDRNVLYNPNDLDLCRMYKAQESYFPGKRFVTQGDIANCIKKLIDRKMFNRLQMLRHIKIIQESRHNTTVCYIWYPEM